MIKAEDITEELISKIEDKLGMGRMAWDMIDKQELIAETINSWNEYKEI